MRNVRHPPPPQPSRLIECDVHTKMRKLKPCPPFLSFPYYTFESIPHSVSRPTILHRREFSIAASRAVDHLCNLPPSIWIPLRYHHHAPPPPLQSIMQYN